MPTPLSLAQARWRKGGLTRAAVAESPQVTTQAARDARMEGIRPEIREKPPHITDEAEIDRRAQLLQRADMVAMSLKATSARKPTAELWAPEL